MEDKLDSKMSRSKTIRKSMREAFGLKKQHKAPLRKIDSRLSNYFRDNDKEASCVPEEKIAKVRAKIDTTECSNLEDADIALALVSDYSAGDPDKALDLLETLERAESGLIEPYSPDVKLVGAVNRNVVTCWLDSVLFAMFARSDDFEPMLFHTFDDGPKRRLAILLRLWVNLLREGKLITAGITLQIQETLSDCGWHEAAGKQQQDASEAFGRITEFLQLPPLTLKRDMFHQGKADKDDHKFTHERTIDIGIPPARKDGSAIKLEDCLENYFDETVNVNRQREEHARRNTVGSNLTKTEGADSDIKNKTLHIEVAEIESSSPTAMTPTSPFPPSYANGRPKLTDLGRAPSIFSEKKVDEEGKVTLSPTRKNSLPNPQRKRSTTIGKQVQMQAFQFFRLIPWYTEGNPDTDLQVAQHFERKRPAVGICLKRFVALNDSGTKWTKRKDFIDIPIESGIPSFLHDDDLGDEVFPNWKFKLSLQSVICHRGASLERGHYVSLARVRRPHGEAPMSGADNIPKTTDPWVLHDDLAKPNRVRYVDIEKALREETPYLLFYKIVQIKGRSNPGRVSMDERPPSYSSVESSSQATSRASPGGSTRPSQSGNATLSTAPSLTRAKSDSSSVISNTPGPPLLDTVPVTVASNAASQTAEEDMRVPQTLAFDDPSLQIKLELRSKSAPAEEPNPAVIAERLRHEEPNITQVEPVSSQTRSRPLTAGHQGSLSRLSQVLRPPSTSRESKERQDVDISTRKSIDVPRASSAVGPPAMSENKSLSTERHPPASKGFRKSMDEMRLSRKGERDREKPGGRDRGLGERLKSKRSERPDRECVIM